MLRLSCAFTKFRKKKIVVIHRDKVQQLQSIIVCLTTWSLEMYIATFRLHTASPSSGDEVDWLLVTLRLSCCCVS